MTTVNSRPPSVKWVFCPFYSSCLFSSPSLSVPQPCEESVSPQLSTTVLGPYDRTSGTNSALPPDTPLSFHHTGTGGKNGFWSRNLSSSTKPKMRSSSPTSPVGILPPGIRDLRTESSRSGRASIMGRFGSILLTDPSSTAMSVV